ncbi:MAG: hypothetical protein AABY22_19360, partial [Nanoarchaeota archaeon]
MGEKFNRFLLIASLIILVMLFLKPSFKPLALGVGPTDYTQAKLIGETNISAVYTFEWFSTSSSSTTDCLPNVQEGYINFNPGSYPKTQSELPDFINNLSANIEFKARNVNFNPIPVTVNACSGSAGSSTANLESYNVTCKINDLGIVNNRRTGDLTCNFQAKFNSTSEGVYGRVTYAFAEVEILKQGVTCISNQSTICSGQNYLVCENNNYVDKGKVTGQCGYTLICTENQNKCVGANYNTCLNNTWADNGIIIGKCGVMQTGNNVTINNTIVNQTVTNQTTNQTGTTQPPIKKG